MEKIFDDYVKDYDMNDPLINLKYHHTFRVEKLCEDIAKSMKFTIEGVRVAKACGLFHDVGRFPQARDYKSLEDKNTIDHAEAGYHIFENRIKDKLGFTYGQKEIIANSIKYHNKLDIPFDITPQEDLFLRITRDADKIDILFLAPGWDIFENISNEPISEKCHNNFINHKCPNINDEQTKNDKVLRYFSFIWDINFYYSLNYISKEGLIDKLYEKTNKEMFKPYYDEIKKYLKECEEKTDEHIFEKYYENQYKFIEHQKEEQEKILKRSK